MAKQIDWPNAEPGARFPSRVLTVGPLRSEKSDVLVAEATDIEHKGNAFVLLAELGEFCKVSAGDIGHVEVAVGGPLGKYLKWVPNA